MPFLSGAVAAVTGAGSGIGRALAQQLAGAGSALALADVDEAGLLRTAQSLGKTSAAVTTHFVNVGDEESVSTFAEDAEARHGRRSRGIRGWAPRRLHPSAKKILRVSIGSREPRRKRPRPEFCAELNAGRSESSSA